MSNLEEQPEGFPTEDPSWDLESLFAGGAESEQFQEFLGRARREVEAYGSAIEEMPKLVEAEGPEGPVIDAWVELIERRQKLEDMLGETAAFARCVSAAQATDPQAAALPGVVGELQSRVETLGADLLDKIKGVDDESFGWLTGREELDGLELYLAEMRRDARRAMGAEKESLAAALNRDGLHAWGDLYSQVSGNLSVDYRDPESEEVERLSVGQAKNRLSNRDRSERRAAFEGLQEAWGGQASTFSSILNSIIGSLETLNDARGVDMLTDPLESNRIERETLDAMLEAAETLRPVLHEYLRLKRRALGVEQLEYFDLNAPVGAGEDDEIAYPDSQEFIVEQIDEFSDRMGRFYRHALASQWVEAEDRAGKAQGGFCIPFAQSGEMRIFMTHGGSMTNVLTLAHELGHAYHGFLMRDLPSGARHVPMTLAESASTLSEKLVEAAAFERAEQEKKLRLLDGRLQRALTFIVDVPARFRLEKAMHESRREGRLTPQGLAETSREIYEEAFDGLLGSLDSYFWSSKLHYFITRQRFYNFPYLFGYLFSKALYDRAREEGPEFSERVDDLLMHSGRMSAEELAEEYLGEDITQVGFWRTAADSIRDDVEIYRGLLEES